MPLRSAVDKSRVMLAMPVANEANCAKHIPLWLNKGYEVLLLQDRFRFPVAGATIVTPFDHYIGWPKAVNWMVANAVPKEVGIVIAAGDDMTPDPHLSAQDIAAFYWDRFRDGLGVMQPTGDDMDGTDRICGSPWMGRGWLDRAYDGKGPMWGGYFQFYADEELKVVSEGLGLLWQAKGITQYHDHWTRKGQSRPHYQDLSQSWWDVDKAEFLVRQASGFPGSTPLPG